MDDTADDLSLLVHGIDEPIVCSRCADEVATGSAGAVSLADYGRLSVGFSSAGLQVWCRRHDGNVVHIDFEGRQPAADFRCISRGTLSFPKMTP